MLAAEAEPCNQLAVAIIVFGLEIVEQLAPLVDHLQETLSRVVIFLVLAKVLGELGNSCGQQRNLNFRRAGIGFRARIVFNYAALVFT